MLFVRMRSRSGLYHEKWIRIFPKLPVQFQATLAQTDRKVLVGVQLILVILAGSGNTHLFRLVQEDRVGEAFFQKRPGFLANPLLHPLFVILQLLLGCFAALRIADRLCRIDLRLEPGDFRRHFRCILVAGFLLTLLLLAVEVFLLLRGELLQEQK